MRTHRAARAIRSHLRHCRHIIAQFAEISGLLGIPCLLVLQLGVEGAYFGSQSVDHINQLDVIVHNV